MLGNSENRNVALSWEMLVPDKTRESWAACTVDCSMYCVNTFKGIPIWQYRGKGISSNRLPLARLPLQKEIRYIIFNSVLSTTVLIGTSINMCYGGTMGSVFCRLPAAMSG